LNATEALVIEMRSDVKRNEKVIQIVQNFQHAMQTEMQNKLKRVYQTVEALPLEIEAFPTLISEDEQIKANFQRIESLLNEEKSRNSE